MRTSIANFPTLQGFKSSLLEEAFSDTRNHGNCNVSFY